MNRQPILIIMARFYEDIADKLLEGAIQALDKLDFKYETCEVLGAFEIPAAIAMAFEHHPHKYDGVIALGCVIRGETNHYDYVCTESARGLNDMAMKHVIAIGNGILTVDNKEQAIIRASINGKNKGAGAAEACIKMLKLKEKF